MVFDCLQDGGPFVTYILLPLFASKHQMFQPESNIGNPVEGVNIEHKPFETRLEAIRRICASVDQHEAALMLSMEGGAPSSRRDFNKLYYPILSVCLFLYTICKCMEVLNYRLNQN